jgi:hypothetical protein
VSAPTTLWARSPRVGCLPRLDELGVCGPIAWIRSSLNAMATADWRHRSLLAGDELTWAHLQ